METTLYPRIGLALGSGGAKGLAHIGVLKVLQHYQIPISFIAGSSIGSMLGAFYAAHLDVTELEKLILSFDRRKSFTLLDIALKGGFIKGNKTEAFIADILGDAKFETLKIPFATVATDINSAESVVFTSGNLVKAIRASISIPALYQPIHYKGHLLADGGLSNPIPVDIAYDMGADIVIAVNLDSVYIDKPFHDLPALSTVPLHSINILRHNLAKQSIKRADIVIAPSDIMHVGIVGWSYLFDNEKAKKIIKEGEKAAEEAMPEIQKIIKQYKFKQTRLGKFVSFFSKRTGLTQNKLKNNV